jgi:outer membrane protein assembly factor BamB
MLRCLALLLLPAVACAGDWPQWLGPNRDGTSSETVAPWKGDLKVLWKKSVDEGNSSPVIAGGLLYLHTKVKEKDAEQLQAFDAKTGDLKWTQTYEKTPFQPKFGVGPRATPTVDGGKVFTLGNTGVLAAWDAATGKPLWKIETLKNPKADNLGFGVSASPLIVGNLVVVQGGNSKSPGVRAYEKDTGKEVWIAGKDPASYAAPVKLGNEIVVLTGANLTGISEKGEVRWAVPFRDLLNESSTTPIRANELIIASSVTAGAIAVKVSDGQATQVWKKPSLTCYFSTPVAINPEYLYLVTGALSFSDMSVTLRCVETKTGKEIWNQPKVGKYHASLLKMGDGKLLMHQDSGELLLLAPNNSKFEPLAKTKICGSTWAHPAIADGKIYVRDDHDLICLSLTGE